MNIKKDNFEKIGSYFPEKDFDLIRTFLRVAPIKLHKEVEVKAGAKIYSQDVFLDEKKVTVLPFYVVGISPRESVSRIDFNFGKKMKLRGSLSVFPGRYEFEAYSPVISSNFFIRFYTIPTTIDLSPPEHFKEKLVEKNRDRL